MEDPRTNRILLIGQPVQIAEAKRLIASLDVPLKSVTRTYTFQHVTAASIDRLMQQLAAAQAGSSLYRSVIDADRNMLIVVGSEEVQQQVQAIKAARDVASPAAECPVQFYKIKNLPAADVLETIRSIERESENGALGAGGWSRCLPTAASAPPARSRSRDPNRMPPTPGSTELPKPPAQSEPTVTTGATVEGASATGRPVAGGFGAEGTLPPPASPPHNRQARLPARRRKTALRRSCWGGG